MLSVAPIGGTFDYNRTFDLDDATVASIQAGKAVVAVHGLDNSTLSPEAQNEKSPPVTMAPATPMPASPNFTG